MKLHQSSAGNYETWHSVENIESHFMKQIIAKKMPKNSLNVGWQNRDHLGTVEYQKVKGVPNQFRQPQRQTFPHPQAKFESTSGCQVSPGAIWISRQIDIRLRAIR